MNICKTLFYVTPPRYFFNRILRKVVRLVCDFIPDVALIAGCTALFLIVWAYYFLN